MAINGDRRVKSYATRYARAGHGLDTVKRLAADAIVYGTILGITFVAAVVLTRWVVEL